ncbi:MAG: 5-formyltetrahydrofolate cyclo-ligase [Oscillospiraceae bacterium]|nr:5-formyltetrahydrofolate cyclo-ligase [Oscillospiraceae bacterium]
MRELKSALRKELIALRKAMSAEDKKAADEDIFGQVRPLLDNAGAVFTYASTDIEVDTRQIIEYCLSRGIPTALPVSGESELAFYFIKSADELRRGKFNIDEPPLDFPAIADEKTLCVVPALCADGNGARLGYGKGYYDRFLSGFTGTSVILCYKEFKRDVPVEPHDIKADFTVFNR